MLTATHKSDRDTRENKRKRIEKQINNGKASERIGSNVQCGMEVIARGRQLTTNSEGASDKYWFVMTDFFHLRTIPNIELMD